MRRDGGRAGEKLMDSLARILKRTSEAELPVSRIDICGEIR